MTISKNQKIFFLSGLILIYAFGIIIQSHSLLKCDDIGLLYLARAVLHGKIYGRDFFESNPPMAILLYMPEILIEKILPVAHVLGLQIYIFLSATLLLFVCFIPIKKLFNDAQTSFAIAFFLIIAFTYLILPFHDFGQREHFFVMLTMPYVLLAACRLQNITINLKCILLIGLLAGIGFSIKPFFFSTFFLIEGYLAYQLYKKDGYFVRPETICVILVTLLYLLSIYIFFISYIVIALPILMRTYYQSLEHTKTFHQTWITPTVALYFFNYFLYYITRKINPFIILSNVLLLAMTGDFIARCMQEPIAYHILPAFLLSAILFIFLLLIYFKCDNKWNSIKLVGIAVTLYVFTLNFVLSLNNALIIKKVENHLIFFVNKIAFHQNIYFLSADDASPISVISYAHGYLNYGFLFWLRRYADKTYLKNESPQHKQDVQYLTTMLARHINEDKPALIFSDNTCVSIKNRVSPINCLHYLLSNIQFQSAWKHYHYIMTIESRRWYNIYERDDASFTAPNTKPTCQLFKKANDAFHLHAACDSPLST